MIENSSTVNRSYHLATNPKMADLIGIEPTFRSKASSDYLFVRLERLELSLLSEPVPKTGVSTVPPQPHFFMSLI